MKKTLESTNTGYRKTKNMKTLEAFAKSGLRRVELVDYPQCDAASCVASFINSIKRFKYTGIRASQRKGRVFLINENIEEVKLTYYNE